MYVGLLKLVYALLIMNQVESAKDAYRRVLERDPGHAKVLQQLGWLHHQENDSQASQDRAIDYLEKSVNSGNLFHPYHLFFRY